jgi:AcrR family transcriptional regulator
VSGSRNNPKTERQQQAADRYQHILETAIRLFARNGFDGTTTRQIAQEAGISEGLIFHYFPNKADLLARAMETQHGFLSDLRDLLSDKETLPVDDVLPKLADLWLDKLWTEQDIISVLFGTAQTNSDVGAELQAVIQEGVSLLAHYLRSRIEAGELRPDLPVETGALMFFASAMIFFVAHRDLPETAWREQAAVFSRDMLSVWLLGAKT